jgi:hypothetical protein
MTIAVLKNKIKHRVYPDGGELQVSGKSDFKILESLVFNGS